MKKILIATDYSPEAENAMNFAASMARENKYEIILFTLQNISIHIQNAQLPAEVFLEEIEKLNQELIKKAVYLKNQYEVSVTSHFSMGNFFLEIKKCYEKYEFDLIVVGMAEKTLEQELLGNITTKILHQLKLPTLAVPKNADYKKIKNILFAYDVDKGLKHSVLKKVYETIVDFESNLEIFNVYQTLDDFNHIISDNAIEMDYHFENIQHHFKIIQSNEVIKAIKEEIDLTGADLLVMCPYKYGFWSSIVHRSKTNIMASGNQIPLLSIPQ